MITAKSLLPVDVIFTPQWWHYNYGLEFRDDFFFDAETILRPLGVLLLSFHCSGEVLYVRHLRDRADLRFCPLGGNVGRNPVWGGRAPAPIFPVP